MAKSKKAPDQAANEKIEKLFWKKCQTKDDLSKWIQYFLGLHLPDCTVSRYADTNPLDVVWKVYDICVNKRNPEDINEILYVAGRGSGKTLGMAIAEFMVMMHDERDAVHVGAILSQAKRCYDYQVKFMLNEKVSRIINDINKHAEDRVLQKMNMEKSVFKINKENITLEILPCTLKAVNGPHVPLVVVDEIDTVSGESVKAFKDIRGMLDSQGDKRALRIGISTRKSRYGLMNQQMENADKEGRKVYRWTAFEFSKRCPDSKSGIIPTSCYILQDKMEVTTEEEWKLKDKKKQQEYVQHTLPGENCLKCPAASICLGDAKKQMSKSKMLKPISDVVSKVMSEGIDWSLAQLMNLKPSVEGIVFKEFEEKIHARDWNDMWRILTGKDFPGECTHDMFVKKCHQLKLPCFAGIDWGYSSPATVVFFFVDANDNIYVVKTDGMTYMSDPAWINYIKMKYHNIYRCQMYYPDQASQGSVVEMRSAGLPAHADPKKPDIDPGVQTIKKFLRVPGSNMPKIFFAKETCPHIIMEFSMYHFRTDTAGNVTDVYDEEFNHWIDALRYPMYCLFGKNRFTMTTLSDKTHSIIDRDGNYNKIPTVEEFCEINNIECNEHLQNAAKIGKIGTLSDLESDDDDNGGSFIWSV